MKKIKPNIQHTGVVGEATSDYDGLSESSSFEESLSVEVAEFKEPDRILIPARRYTPLAKEEVAEMVQEDLDVKAQRERVDRCARVVYGNSSAWKRRLEAINKDPQLSVQLCQQIVSNPRSVSSLAGFELFCLKSNARVEAENHIPLFQNAVENYSRTLVRVGMDIRRECQGVQERTGVMINRKVRDLLALSVGEQREVLISSPEMRGEVHTFAQQCQRRLSSRERKWVSENNHRKLAASLGVPAGEAKEISELIQATVDASSYAKFIEKHEKSPVLAKPRQRSNVMAMAS
ncbi:BID domain-containing T4SS effector [Bartonella sp. B41]